MRCVVLLLICMPLPSRAQSGISRVLVPAIQSAQEQAITTMLVEETQHRTPDGGLALIVTHTLPTTLAPGEQIIAIANRDQISNLLPTRLVGIYEAALRSLHTTDHREGFMLLSLRYSRGQIIAIAGNDTRGELFGAGYLLRQISFTAARPRAPATFHLFSAPDKAIRGHQIGYRNKNNTYDAWTLPQFEQQIRDLAIFGANAIQLIAPTSDDDASSPLYPAPPLDTLLGISGILAKYGLDCDLYYPELRDYTQPENVAAELKAFESVVGAMPRLDALYVPGGDPGSTAPEVLFPVIAREVAILHRYHPGATVWVSAQGFDCERYKRFYRLLDQQPAWLTGVFFGPQSRESFFAQRRRMPARYAMHFYTDIGHTMPAQVPGAEWDPIFALTEGREPICPRPAAFLQIYHRFQSLHTGFITYSEGVNDDVNKMLFSQLGWSSATPAATILSEYARFFLHREGPENEVAVRTIQGLEADWAGPLDANLQIPRTRQLVNRLERSASSAQVALNPRWESIAYRATYDDYVRRKRLRERSAEARALNALTDASLGSQARAAAAQAALSSTQPGLTETQEHARLLALADQLFHDWGLQLSVPRYHAENWERGANLDRIDTPLNDAAWLHHAIQLALDESSEASRIASLEAIAHWQHPSRGAVYDDLGDPANEPHLVRGEGWWRDPELYETTNDGIADRTLAANPSASGDQGTALPWRLSWITYAETLYETPLTLEYDHLNRLRSYHVRITYAGEDYALPLRLTADGIEVHPSSLRQSNPETVEFAVPAAAVSTGTLKLTWTGPQGSGGSGRGCQVAEVWILPQPMHAPHRYN